MEKTPMWGRSNRRKGVQGLYRILLCGDRKDQRLCCFLKKILLPYGKVLHEGTCIGEGNRVFCLEECEDWSGKTGKGILVLKKSYRPNGKHSPLPGWIAVLESGFRAGICGLQDTGIPAVLCGSASRDTLSISSWDAPFASVSILREMAALDGEVVEPGEVLVKMSEHVSRGEMLKACAVLLLCGVPYGKGYFL